MNSQIIKIRDIYLSYHFIKLSSLSKKVNYSLNALKMESVDFFFTKDLRLIEVLESIIKMKVMKLRRGCFYIKIGKLMSTEFAIPRRILLPR